MARITVEDCLNQIPNRFKLTLAATYRARELAQGHAARIDSRDKPTVLALREVAAGLTGTEMLRKVPTRSGREKWGFRGYALHQAGCSRQSK